MKKIVLLILALCAWVWTSAQSPGKIAPGVVLVEVTPEMAEILENQGSNTGKLMSRSANESVRTGVSSFDAISRKYNTSVVKRLFPYHPKYEARQKKHGLHLWYTLKIDENVNLSQAVKSFDDDSHVKRAKTVELPVLYSEPPTNDPMLDKQWHYNNTGQTGGTPGADINLFNAWKKQMSADNVIVAIIDGGVDITHPDLIGNLWINEAELNGTTGVDDDGNGYVDDIYGYNFVYDSGNISGHHHGTHVAGTVAASNNNGIGVAGVAGGTHGGNGTPGSGDGARLMSCQVFATDSDVPAPSNVPAFVYAANNGAVIAQCSWGYETPDAEPAPELVQAIDYFIEYAGKDENGDPLPNTPMSGGIVIFAAGNSGNNAKYWPGCYDKVLSVAALTHTNKKAYYSNFASWVDVSAPGGETAYKEEYGILSTFHQSDNRYQFYQGTSMACPHVSGIAALVVARHGSRSFTPDMLWERLVGSCESVDHLNEGYRGMLGAGLINAELALEDNNGEPPAKVTDLAAALVSSSRIDVMFTAPSDPDNGSAATYEVRYSESPITAGNISNLPYVTKRAKDAGLRDTIKVTGLKKQTKYYFALVSFDVWNNKSELSNILEVTTTGLANIAVSPTDTIRFTIDVTVSPLHQEQVTISNTSIGGISYEMGTGVELDPRPNPTQAIETLTAYKLNYDYSNDVTGSGLETTPFSAANKLTVKSDNFNLTHVRTSVTTLKNTGTEEEPIISMSTLPFIIKVVKGGNTPDEGKVLYSKECHHKDYWGGATNLPLGEQIPFQKGDQFWVILEFPAEYYAPMGVNTHISECYSHSLFSEDGGETWVDFTELGPSIGFPSIPMFRIAGVSMKSALEDFVTFDPSSGFVTPGSPDVVTANFDATNLINGTYVSNIKVASNAGNSQLVNIPVKFNVIGQKSLYTPSRSEIDYGTVMLGESVTETVTIENKGLGVFTITGVTSLHADFSATPATLTIAPQQQAVLSVRYAPSAAGNLTSAIRLATNEGQKTIIVNGSGTVAPEIDLTPNTLTFNGHIGDEATLTFTIKNDGAYKLNYSIPEFMEQQTFAISDLGTGYVAKRSDEAGGPVWAWQNMADATDITRYTESGSLCYVVDLGFTMPYYGHRYDKITITPYGHIYMGEEANISNNYNGLPDQNGRGKTVALLAIDKTFPSKVGGQVLYKQQQDYVVIEYRNFGKPGYTTTDYWGNPFAVPETGTIDAQIVLYNDGNIEFRYDNFNENQMTQLPLFGYALIGIDNEEITDGIQVCYRDQNFINPGDQLAIGFYPPSPKIIKSVIPASGILVAGDSEVITVKVKADEDLAEGTYVNYINIHSNDPVTPKATVTLNANITAESAAGLSVTDLNFGSVNHGYTKEAFVRVANNGGKPFNITGVTATAPFTITPVEASNVCSAFSTKEYKVEFTPAAAIAYADVITFTTDDVATPTLTMNVSGTGILNPAMVISPKVVHNFTLSSGQYADTAIYVENLGETELSYLVNGNEWINISSQPELMSAGNLDSYGYYWVDNDIDPSVEFEWIPIDNAEEHFILQWTSKRYTLPFAFNFYGKNYTEVALSPHGYILFPRENGTDIMEQATSGKTVPIPFDDNINNMIAALRVQMDPYNHDVKKSSINTENFDDKVVFTWFEMVPSELTPRQKGLTVNVQLILYKDGRIKMQYQNVENASWRHDSTIGIENDKGTDGLEISLLQSYTHNDLAVLITPAKRYQLEDTKKHRIPIRINPDNINDGTYNGKLFVSSNAPANSLDSIEYNLTVLGIPDIETADSIKYGIVYKYMNGSNPAAYTKQAVITNKGTKKVTFDAVNLPVDYTAPNTTFPFDVLPGETVAVDLVFTPSTAPNGEVTGMATFVYGDYLTGNTEDIVLQAFVYDPPAADVEASVKNKYHHVKLLAGESNEKLFTLYNNGLSKLDYDWNIEYLDHTTFGSVRPSSFHLVGGGNANAEASGASAPGLTLMSLDPNDIDYSAIAPSAITASFVDTITYNLGYYNIVWPLDDTKSTFATRFKVGDEGFNLTHVGNWLKNYNPEVTMEIAVYKGKEFASARKIYSKDVSIPLNTTESGKMEVFELDKDLYFYPGEYFWIGFTQYSLELRTAIGRLLGSNAVTINDCFIWDFRGFVQTITQSMGGLPAGLLIEAYSDQKLANVPSWITLTPDNGNVEMGQDSQINLKVNSAVVDNTLGDRYAIATLTSNDPLQESIKIYVEMDLNKAPTIHFGTTELSGAILHYYTDENTSTNIPIKVKDAENELCTTVLVDDPANSAENAPVISFTPAGSNLYNFTFTTPYGSEGVWYYRFTATDVNGQQAESVLAVHVDKVYRTPAGMLDDIDIAINQAISIRLDEAFENFDKDNQLTYSIEGIGNERVALTSIDHNNNLHVIGLEAGTTLLTVRALHPDSQLFTDATVNVNVSIPTIPNDVENMVVLVNESKVIDLNQYYSYLNATLSYTASPIDGSIIDAEIENGSHLKVSGKKVGTTAVTVSVNNEDDGTSFNIILNVEVKNSNVQEAGPAMNVFPNPATSHINVSKTFEKPSSVEIRIYRSNGALAFKKECGVVSKLEEYINVSSLPQGIYVVQCVVNNKQVDVKKFTKK